MTSKEWARFGSIAFGVFSCTATIASGGTLSILFGVGCAATIYTIWATSQGEESPILDSSATGVSVGQCAIGIAKKDPISAADCASAIIGIGSKFTETSDDVVLHNQAVIPTKVLSPNANPQQPPILTPEELANYGKHEYIEHYIQWDGCTYHDDGVVEREAFQSDGELMMVPLQMRRIGDNTYEAYPAEDVKYIITYTLDGFLLKIYPYAASSSIKYCKIMYSLSK